MMDYQENEWEREDWERDMNFTIRGDAKYQRKAGKVMIPDRYRNSYLQMYLDDDTDDDTNSSMTSGTTVSSRSVSSIMGICLAGLDNFMYDQPPPSVQKSPHAINLDFSDYPGIVQQILPTTRLQQDQESDWNDDIVIPDHVSLSISSVSTNLYDELIEDDEEPLMATKPPEGVTFPATVPSKPRFTYEREVDDDDDMSGLQFPDDLAHLSSLIEQRKDSKEIPSTRIPNQKVSLALANIERERDDDDFFKDLEIENKTFISKLPQPLSSSSSSNMIKQPTKTIKSKAPTNFISRLARPTPTQHKTSTQLSALEQRNKLLQPKNPVFSRPITTNQRETNGPLTLNHAKFRPSNPVMTERKSPAGFTLIARPKTKAPPKYCTRLDNMDNLNVLPSRLSNTKNTLPIQRICTNTRLAQPANQNKPAVQTTNNNLGRSRPTTRRVPIGAPVTSTSSNLREPRPRVNSRPTVPSRHFEQHTPREPVGYFDGIKDNGLNRTITPNRPSVLSRLNAYNDSVVQSRPHKSSVLSQLNSTSYSKPKDESSRPSVYGRFNTPIGFTTPNRTENRLLGGNPPVFNRSRTTQAKNLKLIQPTRELLKNEYNNMKYDALNHTWRGNEGNVNAVLERPAPRRRPMIISGGQGHAPSRYAAVVGNSMIFNPESRSWISTHGPEHNELDEIEDLQPRHPSSMSQDTHKKPVQFQLPSTSDAIAQQKEHDAFMANWLGLLQ